MKSIKLLLLFTTIIFWNNTNAQTKEYGIQLGKALNALYANLPNDCKNLYGKESEIYKGDYQSKISLPNSTENIFSYTSEYPIILTSYVPAGDDNAKAIIQHNSISDAILATIINYKNKNYKILYLTAESKTGDKADYQYKLENGPEELENVKIYLQIGDNTDVNEMYKFRIRMGIYRKVDKTKLAQIDKCISGDCKNGKGSIEFINGDKYEGDFKNGNPDGQGKYTQKDGATYTGGLKNGKWDGFGTTRYANGDVYVGNYVNDKQDGKGTYTYVNGSIYEGEFIKGIREGKGKNLYDNGDKYEGDFKDGKANGQGTYTEKDGATYTGGFKNSKWDGFGTTHFANGDVYIGNYVNDKEDGQGKYTEKDGAIYTGGFKNGKWDGYGSTRFANGDVYIGNYVNDKQDGKGTHTYANGNILDGIYSNGKITKGKFTAINGNYYDGEWENGKFNGEGKFYEKAINKLSIGIFKDNVFIKETKITIEKTTQIEGCVTGDCKTGKGSIINADGSKYEGDFENNKPEGKGKYISTDGAIYTGSFKNGKFDGFGKMKYNTGETFEGVYSTGAIKKGLYTLVNGDYYNGEFENNTFNGQGKYYTKTTNTIAEGIYKDGKLISEKYKTAEIIAPQVKIPSKEYSTLLSKAFNALYVDMPNNCKSLFGNPMENSKYTYQSKIILPNSIKNTIASYDDFPVIYESNIIAGDDIEMAKQKQNEISKAILSTTIDYKNKNYKIKYLAAESNEGSKPRYTYSLENCPQDLRAVKIYLYLKSNPDDSKPYKFIIAIGVFKQAETKVISTKK